MAALTAVISGEVIHSEGVETNPHLSLELYSKYNVSQFEPFPYVNDLSVLHNTTIVRNTPVEALPRSITTVAATSYYDDYYNTIHITPKVLQLGNIISDLSEEVYVWNAYFQPQTLVAINGLEAGLSLDGQPDPPLQFYALEQKQWDFNVSSSVGSTSFTTDIAFVFSGIDYPSLNVSGQRVVAFSFDIDWSNGINENFQWLTDVIKSETGVEQRRSLRLQPRRTVSTNMVLTGREKRQFENQYFSWGSKAWAVPIWWEKDKLTADASALTSRVECNTSNYSFQVGGYCLVIKDFTTYEVLEIAAIDATGIDTTLAIQSDWPAGTKIYPVRIGVLTEPPEVSRHNDETVELEVSFLLTEQETRTKTMPTETYLSYPVYLNIPNSSTDITMQMERVLLTLDSGSSTPLITDIPNRPFVVLKHDWIGSGHDELIEYTSFIDAMMGRQSAVWVPTHTNDFVVISEYIDGSVELTVENCGYATYGNGQDGRNHIIIKMRDGTILYREIISAVEDSSESMRLTLSDSLGASYSVSDFKRISFLNLCRLYDDEVDIEHVTDSKGVARSSIVFKEVNDNVV